MKIEQYQYYKMVGLVVAHLLSGCVSAPSPGSNQDYWKLQKEDYELEKPAKKPRFITKDSAEKLERKIDRKIN